MKRKQVHNAILHAYGESDEPVDPSLASDAELTRLSARCGALAELTADAPEPELPAALRERVVRAQSPPRRRRVWIGSIAAVAAVLVAAVLLGQLGRHEQPPVEPPANIAKNPVYDDAELDRQFAAAVEMAEQISDNVLRSSSWDQSLEVLFQEIETLGSGLVDPALPEAGSRPTTVPA